MLEFEPFSLTGLRIKDTSKEQIMKKYIGTALTVCIVLSFIVLSIVWHGNAFTNDQMSTFKMLLIVCGCSIAYCFIVGEITRNYSQMDKLWSLKVNNGKSKRIVC